MTTVTRCGRCASWQRRFCCAASVCWRPGGLMLCRSHRRRRSFGVRATASGCCTCRATTVSSPSQGYGFHVGLRVCVGMGAPQACKWTADHRSRLYSQFLVFSRSRYVGGIVRSWTLATRGGAGLVAVRRHGGDAYVGWPADFYTSPSSVKLLAPNASPARFRSIVAPLAARVREQENATGLHGRVSTRGGGTPDSPSSSVCPRLAPRVDHHL